MLLATTGRSAAIASRTTRPKPSLLDGNASASAERYQAASVTSSTVPSGHDVATELEPHAGQRREHGIAVRRVVLERVATQHHEDGVEAVSTQQRQRLEQLAGPLARLDAADGEQHGAAVAAHRGSQRGAARGFDRREAAGSRRRCGRRPPDGRSRRATICRHCSLTTRRRSGSRMACRWQWISASVVKSSTWWTVRSTGTPAPASRTRVAARAEMQSCECSTSTCGASAPRPAAIESTDANTLSSSESAVSTAGNSVHGHRGRPVERPALAGPARRGARRRRGPAGASARRESVHDPAARLGRVGQDRDAQRSQGDGSERRVAPGDRRRHQRRPGRRLGDDAPGGHERGHLGLVVLGVAVGAEDVRHDLRPARAHDARAAPGRGRRPGRGASRSRGRRPGGSTARPGSARASSSSSTPGLRVDHRDAGDPGCTPPPRGRAARTQCGRCGQPAALVDGGVRVHRTQSSGPGARAPRSTGCRRSRDRARACVSRRAGRRPPRSSDGGQRRWCPARRGRAASRVAATPPSSVSSTMTPVGDGHSGVDPHEGGDQRGAAGLPSSRRATSGPAAWTRTG